MNFLSKTAVCIASAAAVLLAGCDSVDQVDSTKSGNSASPRPEAASRTPAAAPPTAADFVVDVIVTEQKCFGSAGCNYRYTINPQYISTKPLPDKTTVIFTVTGGDQDQVGNFTIDAEGTARFDRETSISGEENANLQATVTSVIPGR